jgi:triosephosphate isomerase
MVLAIWEPVHDCGCFGDAFRLTNWETFAKNVLLLIMASFLWVKRSRIVRFVSTRSSRIVTLFALLYIGYVQYAGLAHLPVMDFRPFAIGSDLNEGVRDIPAEFKLLYRYEKDGNVLELDSEGAPDSTWNYLGTRSDVISEGVPARIQDFWFEPMDGGADINEKLLSDSNYTCLLVADKLETADESRVDKINDIYDYCVDNNMPFYALTSSLDNEVALWRKQTGAEYPFYAADNLLLKTMVRSNPGLLVLKEGRVVAKWNMNDVPELYGDEQPCDTLPEKQRMVSMVEGAADSGNMYRLFNSLFMLLVPLMMISLMDILLRQRRKAARNDAPVPADHDTETENNGQTIN